MVGSKQNLPNLIEEKCQSFHTSTVRSTKDFQLFRFQRRFGKKTPVTITGDFLVVRPSQEYVYLIVLVSEPDIWKLGVLPLIESLYPRAVQPFLTQPEIHELLKKVQVALAPKSQRLRVLELSTKKRLVERARKRFESERKWTDADLELVFREAREQNAWFRSVTFDLVREHDGRIVSTGVRAKLSKDGSFMCDGDFELFSRALVDDLLLFSSERLKFFSSRDRLSTPDHAPRPLQITYERDVFKTSNETKRLVDGMHRFKHGTCTVLHANPYVHLSIVDNLDFSSADLWVLSQNEILLVPQMRASHAALKRIVNHIFEYFREGKISEFQEQN